eukprot:1289424-Pyramimonas_sp.AAC.1
MVACTLASFDLHGLPSSTPSRRGSSVWGRRRQATTGRSCTGPSVDVLYPFGGALPLLFPRVVVAIKAHGLDPGV